MTDHVPGWYRDAMEQNLGLLLMAVKAGQFTVQDLYELMCDPKNQSNPDRVLDEMTHVKTLALLAALAVFRLALYEG